MGEKLTDSPQFEALWQAVKGWDIQRRPGDGYAEANGSDVLTILDALSPWLSDGERGRSLVAMSVPGAPDISLATDSPVFSPMGEPLRTNLVDARARVYNLGAGKDQPGQVAEIHLGFHAVAQVAATPDGNGFLIRVWPSNGTHEYGGDNSDFVSLSVEFDAHCDPHLTSFNLGR